MISSRRSGSTARPWWSIRQSSRPQRPTRGCTGGQVVPVADDRPHETAAAAEPPAAAIMDWARLEELAEYDTADGEVVKAAVSSFVGLAPEKLSIMRQSIKGRDAQRLRESAHALKGAASNVGAAAVAAGSAHLEIAGRSASFDGAQEMLASLSVTLEKTLSELNGVSRRRAEDARRLTRHRSGRSICYPPRPGPYASVCLRPAPRLLTRPLRTRSMYGHVVEPEVVRDRRRALHRGRSRRRRRP